MSMSDLTTDERRLLAGSDAEPSADDHECDGEPPAKVYVDGTQIPVINDGIRLEFRKDGPLSLNGHAEVYFPSEWNDQNYGAVVRALDPSQDNVYDPVDIDIRDEVSGEYVTVHRGFVMGVGGGKKGNLERRMHVGDVSQLLGAIPFSGEYNQNADIEKVLTDAVDTINEQVAPVFGEIELGGSDPGRITPESRSPTISFFEITSAAIDVFIRSGKKFELNKHTVQDVFDWLEDKTDLWFYFAPSEGDGVDLVVERNPTKKGFEAGHVSDGDGDFEVIENNALYEIKPYNTVTVQGEQYRPSFEADYEEYPRATATHTVLKEKAGITLQPEVFFDESASEEVITERAKEELKQLLDDAGHGEIILSPAPNVTPFSTITAQPACGDRVEEDVPPFEYEVEEVVHRIAARTYRNNERIHQTTCRVSTKVDIDDIEVETEMVKGDEVSSGQKLLEELTVGLDGPPDGFIDDITLS